MKIHESYKKYVNLIKERNINMAILAQQSGYDHRFSKNEISMDATKMACKDFVFNQIIPTFPWR